MRNLTADLLYPPPPAEAVVKILSAVVTFDRDAEGNYVVRRTLGAGEREMLTQRQTALLPFATRAKRSDVETILLRMFTRFAGFGESEKETAVKVREYADMLVDLPAWAVHRAAERFSQGLVKAEEVGSRTLRLDGAPSSAQLYKVAAALSHEVTVELHRIGIALRGVTVSVRQPPTTEQLERVRAAVQQRRIDGAQASAADAAARAEREQESRRREAEAREKAWAREFEAAGLPAPDVPKDNRVSLTLMLKMGYRIEDGPRGGKILVSPARARVDKAGRSGEEFPEQRISR